MANPMEHFVALLDEVISRSTRVAANARHRQALLTSTPRPRGPPEHPLLIALLSDIHANFEALDACLRHARERGVERHAFLGDFVGYGADPAGVVEIVERYAEEGAVGLKG